MGLPWAFACEMPADQRSDRGGKDAVRTLRLQEKNGTIPFRWRAEFIPFE